MRRFLYLVTKKCRIYAACGVSQTPTYFIKCNDLLQQLKRAQLENRLDAKVIEDIHKAMKHIDDDELVELSVRVAGKLESISDEEYARLVLEAAE